MDLATLGLAVDSRPVADASKDLDRISAAAKKAEDATAGFGKRAEDAGRRAAAANDNVARSANKVTAAYDKWHTAARRVAAAVGAIAGALAVRSLTSYADAWSDMQSRVGAAIRDMEAAPALMQRIVDIANASYSPLAQTVEIYGRNVAVLRDLGRTATEAADFTEALNHALVLTATRGERAASVQNALSKAMAVGKMQAQELETILAHGGEVAQVLADELGTTVNGLRAMASAGKITGDVIANALIKRLDDLRERAGEMPATIGDAFVRIQTNLTAFIGTMDKAAGASEMAATALLALADSIGRIVTYAATAVTMFGTYYVAAFVAARLATVTLAGALTLLRAALIRTGIGALVVAAGELVYQFGRLVEAAGGFGNAVALLGDVASEVVARVVDIFGRLPAAIADIAIQMGQRFADGIRYGINEALLLVGDFLMKMNELTGSSFNRPKLLGPVSLDNPFAGAAAGLGEAATAPLKSIQAIRDAMSDAAKETDAAAGAAARLNDALEKTGGGAADKAAKAIKGVKDEADKAAESARKFGADLVKGFVSDLRSGLEQGKGFWKSFGDAALKVLDKIVDKLLNELIDALFKVNSEAGGGGGGFLGGLFRAIGSIFGFAQGGYTGPGAASQPAGIVHAGEFVFSKKAVDRIGLGYLNALHTAAKGYASGGYVRAHAPANMNLRGYQQGGLVQQQGGGREVIEIVLRDDSGRMAEIADQQIELRSGAMLQMSVQQSTKLSRKGLPGASGYYQKRGTI